MLRLFLLFSLLLASCEKKPPTILEGFFIKIPYKIVFSKSLNQQEKRNVIDKIDKYFEKIDLRYNFFNSKSELFRINQIKETTISNSLYELLKKSNKLVHLTEGRFDPTIKSAKNLIGWDNLKISKNYLQKTDENLKIDLSSIAKGYAVDLICEKLKAFGYKDFLVEWGGEIKCFGNSFYRQGFNIQINTIKNNKSFPYKIVNLKNKAIATSGSFMLIEKNKSSHIINPFSKKSINSNSEIVSASVISKNCYVADALATALMTFEKKENAKKFVKKICEKKKNIKFIVVYKDEI